MTIYQVRAAWSGLGGSPGVSTWFTTTEPDAAMLTEFKNFFVDVGQYIAAPSSIQVEGTGVTYNETTGALTGGWSATPPAAVVSGTTSQHPAGAGLVVRWETGTVWYGRRLVGHTYVVPLATAAWASSGTPTSTVITAMQGSADDLIANVPSLSVWSRPQPSRDGSVAAVTSAVVPQKAALLRSRRD